MSYDPALALQCARMSASAYESNAAYRCNFYICESATQAMVIERPERIFIVFRGTTYEDILTDLQCRRRSTPMGGIHRGFFKYALHSFQPLMNYLSENNPLHRDPRPLVFAGHSLGGAAAVIAAAHFDSLGYQIEAVYTYGEPRVGNAEFKGYANAAFGPRHFRHVNGHDGVPLAPPWLAGYRHSGQLIYFSTRGQRRVPKMTPLKMVLERLPLLLTRPWKWAQSKRVDHAVFLYVAACERNLKDPEK